MSQQEIKPYYHPNIASARNSLGPIIVIGAHRSGTRLVNQVLESLNVHMGETLESNHESVTFLAVNRLLLHFAQAHWSRPGPFLKCMQAPSFYAQAVEVARSSLDRQMEWFGVVPSGHHWGWKDPRTTITLSVWLSLFPEARVVHAVRNGVDAALSLKRRERRRLFGHRPNKIEVMLPPTFCRAFRLWSVYMVEASRYAGCDRFYEVRYEDILANPVLELAKLCENLGIPVDETVLTRIAGSTVRRPSSRSSAEQIWVKFLFVTGILDRKILQKWGYSFE